MKDDFNIRRLYRPVQPTVEHTEKGVTYREFLPDAGLQNIIYCYWELSTTEDLQSSFVYRVVADGCIDIFFQLDDPAENYVMGFCKRYVEFPLDNTFHYIGIRFFPTMFPALFNVDAKELSNRFERLEWVLKEASGFIKNSFSEEDCYPDIHTKLDRYFLNLIQTTPVSIDARFKNALNIVLKNLGAVTIQSDLDTGLSPRQLRRYFEFYIGDTAKTFSQVVRFQSILNAKPSTRTLSENKVFFDLGYYDQAHYIKEFRNFYGITPGRVFGR